MKHHVITGLERPGDIMNCISVRNKESTSLLLFTVDLSESQSNMRPQGQQLPLLRSNTHMIATVYTLHTVTAGQIKQYRRRTVLCKADYC